MRLTAVLLTLACLAACGGVQTMPEHSSARDDEWRQRQAELDAHAIMQGMAEARQRAEQLARMGH
jgi:outer membrane biogenesis lipoprotein LolB